MNRMNGDNGITLEIVNSDELTSDEMCAIAVLISRLIASRINEPQTECKTPIMLKDEGKRI